METKAPIGSVSLEAKITRADGTIEDLGRLAYYHKRWYRRLAWHLTQKRRHRG